MEYINTLIKQSPSNMHPVATWLQNNLIVHSMIILGPSPFSKKSRVKQVNVSNHAVGKITT